MSAKKLEKGVILYHGSPFARRIPQGSFRGPGWFATTLKPALWYAGPLAEGARGERDVTGMQPGILVYEVTKPANLVLVGDRDIEEVLYDLLVKRTGLLTWEEWSTIKTVGWGMEWSADKWPLAEFSRYHRLGEPDRAVEYLRKHAPDRLEKYLRERETPPAETAAEKMKQHGIDGVVGAIRAICRADPSFKGWTRREGDEWEVMLCEPSQHLRRVDLWEVAEDPAVRGSERWHVVKPERVAARWLTDALG